MRLMLIAAVLALTACNPSPNGGAEPAPAEAQTAQADGTNNCPATASAPWNAGGQTITIDASAVGVDCANAQATILFRTAAGAELYVETFEVSQVMVLAGAESRADMERMLREWIMPPGAAADSTGDLPEWPTNATLPGDSEFPFHPEQGVDRAAYAALRTADQPMFCYVQGMESQACVTLEGRALRLIGVQQFPG
jgi:hypothetical protein